MNPFTKEISRRNFLTVGSLTIAGLATQSLTASPLSFISEKVIRVGLIGCGSRGVGLGTLLQKMDGIQLMACCDVQPAHLQNGMNVAAHGARSYQDYRKLLEDKNIDAIIIATPLFLHYPMAIAALQAEKHIYLEKSLSYNIDQALDIVKKVRESKKVFQVGYQYRYYDLYKKVKNAIDNKWMGTVTQFNCQYNRNSNWRNPVDDPSKERLINWRMYREYCGGPLSELCAHQIDMVNYLLGSHPLKVTGMGGINYWKDGRDTYDNISTVYEYPGGVKSTFTSILSNAFNGYNIRILGDKATIEIQREKAFIYAESTDNLKGIVDGVTGATMQAITQGKPVEIKFENEEAAIEPTILSLQDFVDCINTGKKPLSNVETAKETSIAILMGNAAADTEIKQAWKEKYSV